VRFATAAVLANAAVLAAAACGPAQNGNPDGGDTTPADGYFGLAERRCWEYAIAGGGTYSIEAVALDTVTVPGARTFKLLHRLNGLPQKTEYLEPTAATLLLRERVLHEGGQDRVHAFEPGLVLLRHPTARGDHVETASTRTERLPGQTATTAPITATLDVLAEVSAEVPAGTFSTFSGTLRTDADAEETRLDKFNFAAEQGFVKLDPHGRDLDDLQLKALKTLGSGDLCGAE
jgi:hypothetical protein